MGSDTMQYAFESTAIHAESIHSVRRRVRLPTCTVRTAYAPTGTVYCDISISLLLSKA